MAHQVHLTPELERFAESCVEGGRYGSIGEVVRAGLRLLQEAEERRAQFGRMLDEVRAEAARDGSCPAELVLAEMDAILARE
jgi:antitoxin ParD1/3/4